MSRKLLGEKAMTAAERQRRRRAKVRADKPPQKPGRPRLSWLEESLGEILSDGQEERSARRHHADRQYASFGKQILGIDPRFDGYSAENVERYKPLMRKGILEQLGRHFVFVAMASGEQDDAVAEVREWADDLLIEAKNNQLTVADAVSFFRGLRQPEPTPPAQ